MSFLALHLAFSQVTGVKYFICISYLTFFRLREKEEPSGIDDQYRNVFEKYHKENCNPHWNKISTNCSSVCHSEWKLWTPDTGLIRQTHTCALGRMGLQRFQHLINIFFCLKLYKQIKTVTKIMLFS